MSQSPQKIIELKTRRTQAHTKIQKNNASQRNGFVYLSVITIPTFHKITINFGHFLTHSFGKEYNIRNRNKQKTT